VKFKFVSTRLIAGYLPVSKANSRWQVKSHHTGARLAEQLKDVLDRFELTDSRLPGITTDNASSNYSMTHELQSTLEASSIEWRAVWNHIPCMPHVIPLASGASMSSPAVKGRTKSWEAPERNKQFGENESKDIGKSQRVREEGNA